jgi:hypothetical protein
LSDRFAACGPQAMTRLTIKINGHTFMVYQKNDVWRGGMVAFGIAPQISP